MKNRFRGKKTSDQTWVYGYLIGNDVIVGKIVEWGDEYFNTEFWWKVESESTGQCTGLFDDTDETNDIFSGDILSIEYQGKTIYCKVVIDSGAVLLVSDEFEGGFLLAYDMLDNDGRNEWIRSSKIVGNVVDNPELLGPHTQN